MKKTKTPSVFMKHLEYYVNTYMTEARGLSPIPSVLTKQLFYS